MLAFNEVHRIGKYIEMEITAVVALGRKIGGKDDS
jgi:hypothetical protein